MQESDPHLPSSATGLLEVKPGEPTRHEHLTVFPLIADEQPSSGLKLLLDALNEDSLIIREVGDGSVPTLIAINKGEIDILVFDGEQLIGAKQNRITNRSMFLGAGTETEIPVSCMEQGRWHFDSDTFRPSHKPRHAPSRVRRKAREVEAAYAATPHLAGTSSLRGAQSRVWNEIEDYRGRLDGESATSAMDELYDRHDQDLDAWVARFELVDGQVGLLAFLGNKPLSLDVVGSQDLYSRLHERFLGGYVMDAFAAAGEQATAEAPGLSAAEVFLSAVGGATRGRAPTVGKGTYRLLSSLAIGGELEADERLVHLSAFPVDDQRHDTAHGADTAHNVRPFMSPSARRRYRYGSS